ncbi:hypothetical protein N8878_02355 [Psychromonas sp.]|nr:hypothetical protein [Psychromonas sp.]
MIIGKSSKHLVGILLISFTFSAQAHESHTHSAPWQVCESKKVTEACEYTNGEMDIYKGTCQVFNSALMCVRNQPIVHAESSTESTEKNVSGNTATKVN